jgi:hypothetical protein
MTVTEKNLKFGTACVPKSRISDGMQYNSDSRFVNFKMYTYVKRNFAKIGTKHGTRNKTMLS